MSPQVISNIEAGEPQFDLKEEFMQEVSHQLHSDEKREIIEKLQDDILNEMRGELIEAYRSYREHKHGDMPVDPDNEKRLIAGALFELLIQNDSGIYSPGELTPLNERLVALTHDPQRYGMKKAFGYAVKNPDATYFELKEGGVVVVHAIGEAKMGLLDERCIKQMKASGSREGVTIMVREVNKLLNPENPADRDSLLAEHGFIEIMGRTSDENHIKELQLDANSLEQILVVPAHRILPDMLVLKNVQTLEDLYNKDYEDAVNKARLLLVPQNEAGKELRTDDALVLSLIVELQHVTIKKSVFDARDVYALAALVYKDIVASDEWQQSYVRKHEQAGMEISRVAKDIEKEHIPEYIDWIKSNLVEELPEFQAIPMVNVSPEDATGRGKKIYRHEATGIEGDHEKDHKKAKVALRQNLQEHLNMWKVYLQQRDGSLDLSKISEETIQTILSKDEK